MRGVISLTTVTVNPFTKWDLERCFYGDPALSTVERFVAIQLLKSLDDKFQPVKSRLHSQGLIGYRIGAWRESVNRALRKLVTLGYFVTRWVSVDRRTVQGIKGVTRVMVELGPALRPLVEKTRARIRIGAGQPRCVMPHHPSPTPPGSPGTVGSDVVANSADRIGWPPGDSAQFKRKTLEEWPRLAGSKPASASRLASAVPFAELGERRDGAELRGYSELTDEELAARRQVARRRGAEQTRAELERLDRQQPRRKRPRSQR